MDGTGVRVAVGDGLRVTLGVDVTGVRVAVGDGLRVTLGMEGLGTTEAVDVGLEVEVVSCEQATSIQIETTSDKTKRHFFIALPSLMVVA